MFVHSPRSTQWLQNAQWGLFFHFLESPASTEAESKTSADAWNGRVDAFAVSRLVENVVESGARYVMWTLGQNSGHFCSPNATYDHLTGIVPSKCSRRDLWRDIALALREHGIKTFAYLPAGAPEFEPRAVEALEWVKDGGRLAPFQTRWEAIIREWSERWGDLCAGWWIDGCYFPNEMYEHEEAPNFASFAGALRAGNPGALVAFNPGVQTPVIRLTPEEDYTAGELDGALAVGAWTARGYGALGSSVDGAQLHVLTFAGENWGSGPPRFCAELMAGYTRLITDGGGAITWDVPFGDDGEIPAAFHTRFAAIGAALHHT